MKNKLHSQLSTMISMAWVSNGNFCSFIPNITVIVTLQGHQPSNKVQITWINCCNWTRGFSRP